MEDYIDIIEQMDVIDQMYRRPQVFRDRLDPFVFYDDEDFVKRFRFRKENVIEIMQMLGNALEPKQRKIMSVSPLQQLLISLRFYATGTFQLVDCDLFGVSQPTISGIVRKVSDAIASKYPEVIQFPRGNALLQVQRGFMNIGGIPGVVGAIDCTHIPIQSPGGMNAELFRNRKGFFSINVQAICDSDCNFTNIVARWPGSTHDSRIFDNNNICARFERGEINGMLLGDNGYPLRQYLMTPLLHCTTRAETRYNNAHCHTRVKIENALGILKRTFPCLRIKLAVKLPTTLHIIVACAVLYNLRRKWNLFLPADDYDHDDDVVDRDDGGNAPVQMAQNRNQGGQGYRTFLIRHFQ